MTIKRICDFIFVFAYILTFHNFMIPVEVKYFKITVLIRVTGFLFQLLLTNVKCGRPLDRTSFGNGNKTK